MFFSIFDRFDFRRSRCVATAGQFWYRLLQGPFDRPSGERSCRFRFSFGDAAYPASYSQNPVNHIAGVGACSGRRRFSSGNPAGLTSVHLCYIGTLLCGADTRGVFRLFSVFLFHVHDIDLHLDLLVFHMVYPSVSQHTVKSILDIGASRPHDCLCRGCMRCRGYPLSPFPCKPQRTNPHRCHACCAQTPSPARFANLSTE